VKQVALQHDMVLRHDRDHHGRLSRALRLVNRRRIGQPKGSEPAEGEDGRAAFEVDRDLALWR